MTVPGWSHRGTNDGYQRLFAAVVVAAVFKVLVARFVLDVTVVEEVDETEKVVDGVRR